MEGVLLKFVPHGTLFEASRNSSGTGCSARGIVLTRSCTGLTDCAYSSLYVSRFSSTPHQVTWEFNQRLWPRIKASTCRGYVFFPRRALDYCSCRGKRVSIINVPAPFTDAIIRSNKQSSRVGIRNGVAV
jgi:hypothetical protein